MRTVQNLNDNWLFTKEDKEEFSSITAPNDWTSVTLPHTWNAEDIMREDNEYYEGQCWYYKDFKKTADMEGKKVYLEILAASNIAHVYLNGNILGVHETGFATFRYEISEQLKEENHLSISVDNRKYDFIYPGSADFTFEGGLYRGVNIVIVEPAHFAMEDDGSCGIYITPKLEEEHASVHVKALCEGADGCEVLYEIRDHEGNVVKNTNAPAGVEVDICVADPHLWNGVQDPYLYTLHAALIQDDVVLDEVTIPFGIRTIHFDPEQGMYLNGVKTYMKGVSRHQDFAGCGWATTEKEMKEDIALIKEVGSNSIRLAHYQHNAKFYDLCDEAGLLNWAEIPFISVMTKNPKAHENCRIQLRELIKQNYNHPSIFCWGISNEITIGGETEEVYQNNVDLNNLAHALDASRPTTMAHMSMVKPESKMNNITDIEAYNHYFGWYGGVCEDMEAWLLNFHKVQPNVCLGISEYGAEGILQYHNNDPKRGDYSEEYQVEYHEKNISIFEKMPWMWGSYVWNMFDFSSKFRNEGGRKAMNNKGLVTFDRKTKKDAFYVYKAHWSDVPFVHINGARYKERAEEITKFLVYSNCKEVELFVNGVSVGTCASRFAFSFTDIALQMGDNMIKAIGDGAFEDEIIITRVSEPNKDYVFEDAKNKVDNWFGTEEANMEFPEGYYSVNDTIGDLMENEACKEAIGKVLPEVLDNPMLSMGASFPFSLIFDFSGDIPKECGQAINEALTKIKKEK